MSAPARILVVDDEPMMRHYLAQALRSGLEVEVDEAGTAEQALELFADGLYDLVLTDIILPGLDGLALLRRLREARPAIPVLMVTGFPTVEREQQAFSLGAVKFLTKPVDSGMLIAVVGEMLGRAGKPPADK